MADQTKAKARQARLAQALRTNLRRRKAPPAATDNAPADGCEPTRSSGDARPDDD